MLVFLLLSSCSVDQEVQLGTDAGGTTTLEITLEQVLTTYFTDLAASMGAGEERSIFVPEDIRRSFSARPGVTAERVAVPQPGTLELELSFTDIGSVVASEGEAVQRLVSVSQNDGETTVSFRVTPRTVRDALRLSPMYGSEAASFILPPESGSISASVYTEQLAWALEEYEQGRPIREVITGSTISLRVHVDGQVTSQRGGEQLSSTAVRFELPVVELLTVQEERLFQVSFR